MTIACHARDKADAAMLLDALDIQPGCWQWNAARVGWLVLARAQHGRPYTANDIRAWTPARAARYIAPAMRWLMDAGLAERLPGQLVTSTAPGANRRRIPVYQLTEAGEVLSWEVSPASAAGTITLNYIT